MKAVLLFIFICFCNSIEAQEIDTLKVTRQDSAIVYSIELQEVIVSKDEIALDEERRKLLILKRRVFKTYPYAKMTSEKLKQLNATMTKLKTNKEKKKYFKIVEKYLQEEFEPRLKKLSRKDGQILVKLIYRQTGETTFGDVTLSYMRNAIKLWDLLAVFSQKYENTE